VVSDFRRYLENAEMAQTKAGPRDREQALRRDGPDLSSCPPLARHDGPAARQIVYRCKVGPLVTSAPQNLVRLSIQHDVQRFLHQAEIISTTARLGRVEWEATVDGELLSLWRVCGRIRRKAQTRVAPEPHSRGQGYRGRAGHCPPSRCGSGRPVQGTIGSLHIGAAQCQQSSRSPRA
jgi:hypothetical protein